ncbi:uncharacterized protein LOC123681104 [Harmonia axyridis]|uniref:uncharacterized protein LOC123681104 n=1 Tax=Harmonia axyridis TaxID=115357 RepID=UPI001E277D85|nr:uncharacterized protein LOC123681104 [Harmonia axyridis]
MHKELLLLTIFSLLVHQIAPSSPNDIIFNDSEQADSILSNINQIVKISYKHLNEKLDTLFQSFYSVQKLCEEGEALKPEIVMECVQEYGNTLRENVEVLPEKLIDFIGDLIDLYWTAVESMDIFEYQS